MIINLKSENEHIVKRKKTLEDKYGEDYDKIIQKNRENAIFEKYGVYNSFQISEIKKKRSGILCTLLSIKNE